MFRIKKLADICSGFYLCVW